MTATSAPLEPPTGKTMLDVVMSAASLVSKTDEIDIQLDRVRAITAQRTRDQLTTDDNRTLSEVYTYIEDYLVTKESLRSFTREAIRQAIYDRLKGAKRQSGVRRPLIVTWVVALLSILGAMIAPESLISSAVKPTLAISAFFVAIDLGAAWMFWAGLQNFKDEIRQAYLPICLGIAVVGLTLLQSPFAVSIGQDNSIIFHYITSGITVPAAELLMYIGIRRFAKIGGVHNRLMSMKLVATLCIGAAVLVALIPWPDTGVPNWALVTSLIILTVGAILSIVGAVVAFDVRRVLSATYRRPLAWFIAMLLISAFSCAQYAFLQIIATREHAFEPRGAGLLILVVSAFITLQAGISFRRIGVATTKQAIPESNT